MKDRWNEPCRQIQIATTIYRIMEEVLTIITFHLLGTLNDEVTSAAAIVLLSLWDITIVVYYILKLCLYSILSPFDFRKLGLGALIDQVTLIILL